MISCLTHLRIVEKIKERIPEVDLNYMIMGSIAPYITIPDIKDDFNTHLHDFYYKYLMPGKIMNRSDKTRSFFWGYYFYFITEKLWQESYYTDISEKHESSKEHKEYGDVEYEILREMALIDNEFIKASGSLILDALRNTESNISFFDETSIESIKEYKEELVKHFESKEKEAEVASEYQYISVNIIEEYIKKAAEKCIGMLVS